MNKDESINAIPGPVAPVLPPVGVAAPLAAPVTPVVGVVMLDTQFPRPPGDVGNFAAWGVPVNFQVVRGIWPDKVVQSAKGLRAGRVVPAFVAMVRHLEKKGVAAITTSCGFLVLLQKELQAAVRVPVVTSSLLLLPRLLRQEAQVGVLTISAGVLGEEHLRSAGVPRDRVKDVMVQGVDPQGEFASGHPGQPRADGFGTRRGRRGGCRAGAAGACTAAAHGGAGMHQHAALCAADPCGHRLAGAVIGFACAAPHAAPPASLPFRRQ
jgi:hypothetical protein